MSILDKFAALAKTRDGLRQMAQDPLSVTFDEITSPVEARIGDREVLIFGSNNYLGMTYQPAVVEAGITALKKFGAGTSGSRIANGTYAGHAALEARIAKHFGFKHCMVFSTGYQANLGTISTLAAKGDHLILDADSHASIYDGSRLGNAEVIRFRHSDPADLDKRLKRLEGLPGEKLVVIEGIYSMLGDRAPVKELVEVAHANGAYILVDEAHSFGVLGPKGLGAAEEAGVMDQVDFIVGTFSKSLGGIGGYCVSNIEGFDILRVTTRPYMFTASLPPAVVASTLAALDIIEKDSSLQKKVWANAERYYAGLKKAGFTLGSSVSPIVSVQLPDIPVAAEFWDRLLKDGIYVNLALPPATPSSSPLLRTSVTAAHAFAHIDKAVEIITRIGTDLGVVGA